MLHGYLVRRTTAITDVAAKHLPSGNGQPATSVHRFVRPHIQGLFVKAGIETGVPMPILPVKHCEKQPSDTTERNDLSNGKGFLVVIRHVQLCELALIQEYSNNDVRDQ